MEKISRRCVEAGCECLKPPPDRYLRLEDDEYEYEEAESSIGSYEYEKAESPIGCDCLQPPPDRYLRLEDDEYEYEEAESSIGSYEYEEAESSIGCECLQPPPDRYLKLEDDEYEYEEAESSIGSYEYEEAESPIGSSFSEEENSRDNLMKRKRSTGDISVVESDDDDESCGRKQKKNRREEKSGNNFLCSLADDEEEGLYDDEPDTTHAQPLIRCAWTGTFEVHCDEPICHRRIYSFNAFLSTKTCQAVCNVAAELEPELYFEMLPKPCVWPKSFRGRGPTTDDIALYFFPPSSMMHESLYDSLVSEMIRYDLGMRASLQESDLLIFASDEFPLRFRRFQGKFYLWGVFRAK